MEIVNTFISESSRDFPPKPFSHCFTQFPLVWFLLCMGRGGENYNSSLKLVAFTQRLSKVFSILGVQSFQENTPEKPLSDLIQRIPVLHHWFVFVFGH